MNAPLDPAGLDADAPQVPAEVAADITLSICIPTYNRAHFLVHLLPNLREASAVFDFTWEIVISDNNSTDDTAEVVERFRAEGMPIRYFKQAENKLGWNIVSAFHRAHGKYVTYLADDDLILPEALADNIRFMQANPELRACYTPWEIWNDLNKTSDGYFYRQADELMVFGPGQELDLFGALVRDHIFPEIGIFRADAARSMLSMPRFCYGYFSFLAGVVADGPVALRSVPFYRSVTQTAIVANRGQAGIEGAMTDWDAYRGGLEYMVFSALRRTNSTASDELRTTVRDLIDHFIAERMKVALKLWLARKDYARAYEIVVRLQYLHPAGLGKLDLPEHLPLMALAHSVAQVANGTAEIERVVVAGVEDGQALGGLFREAGLERRILVVPPPKTPSAKNLRGSLVFIANEGLRQQFLDQGYSQNLIISEAEFQNSVLL
ncbi:glycosyltransferase family 2 protein [Xanthobacteraceae bacterium A53D]